MSCPTHETSRTSLLSLPNEILITTLSLLPTVDLLPYAAVSSRFHDLVLRILHRRLLVAASFEEDKLILECYHPAAKYTQDYFFCDYLGTPGLSNDNEGEGSVYHDAANVGRLGRLGGLYSRFRPIRMEDEDRIFRNHPIGSGASHSNIPAAGQGASVPLVQHHVNLDADEPFSQLYVVTNLIQLGPRRGLFKSFVNVSDDVTRLKRDWLAARARDRIGGRVEGCEGHQGPGTGVSVIKDRTILWLGPKNNVGIRARVEERAWRRNQPVPVLMGRDEDPAVSYCLEYEELLIRTTHLLLTAERVMLQDSNESSGRAMVFGSFASRTTTDPGIRSI